MKRLQLNLQIAEHEDKLLELFSLCIGKSKSHVTRMALEIITKFDPEVWQRVELFSKETNMPIWAIIQNFVIAQTAEIQAYQQTWGHLSQDHSLLFTKKKFEDGQEEPFTGEEFGSYYFTARLEQLEREKAEGIIKHKENHNLSLNQDERALLIRMRMGKTWYESEEYKLDCERQQRFEKLRAEGKISEGPHSWGDNMPETKEINDMIAAGDAKGLDALAKTQQSGHEDLEADE